MPRGVHIKPLDLTQIQSAFDESLGGRPPSRDERIYSLRLQAKSVREIAAIEDCTPDEVEEAIFRVAAVSRSRLAAETAIGPILEIDRMDLLLRALIPVAITGDGTAIDRVNLISRERRKLMGMDAPEVKATLTANLDSVDLKLLDAHELKVLESIQQKLKRPPQLGAVGSSSGGSGAERDVIDAVFIPAAPTPDPEPPPVGQRQVQPEQPLSDPQPSPPASSKPAKQRRAPAKKGLPRSTPASQPESDSVTPPAAPSPPTATASSAESPSHQ